MNKCLLAVVLLSGVLKAQGEEILFKENFSGTTLADWGALDRDRDGVSWELAQGSYVTEDAGWDGDAGTLMTVTSFNMELGADMGPLDSDDVIFSPVIKIPKKGDVTLTYKIGVIDTETHMGDNMNDITYQFFVVEDGKEFLPTMKPLDEKNFKNSKGAETKTINLNDYRGKSVRLFWRQINTFGQFVLLLDDVEVKRKYSFDSEIFTVAPNPVQDILYIGGVDDIHSYKIYNSVGRLVKQGSQSTEINVSDLPTGVYVIVVEDVKGRIPKSTKFIKK